MNKEIGYFTITTDGKRRHRFSFELAAYAIYHHSNIERIVEIENIIVDGQITTRERDVTTRAIDFLSTF
jgi:hypothetical protein